MKPPLNLTPQRGTPPRPRQIKKITQHYLRITKAANKLNTLRGAMNLLRKETQ